MQPRFQRGQHDRAVRVAVIAGFLILLVLAIGVPLLSKPKTLVNQEAQVLPPTPIPEVEVFMPLQRVSIGSALSPAMFRKEKMSLLAVSSLGGQPVRSEVEVNGRFAKSVILPGRPLMVDQLMDAPENMVVRKIIPGYRAVTIKVDDVSGIEGWSLPGARVDVLWFTQQSKTGDNEPMVSTIVRNVQVLSVMGRTEASSSLTNTSSTLPNRAGFATAGAVSNVVAPGSAAASVGQQVQVPSVFTVTLLVSPQDGQKLFLASTTGRLSLMLRGEFEAPSEGDDDGSLSARRLLQSAGGSTEDEAIQGTMRARREDGTFDEWSLVEGKIVRWERADQ